MIKLRKTGHLHFVGIGGIGMSGIAEVLLNLGYRISGSDLVKSDTTDRLGELGGEIYKGHDPGNIEGADVVIISSAVRPDNPEIVTAKLNGIPVIPRAIMLNELMRMKYGIAVAGSHGKTTTTSMIATIMAQAQLDPTIIIGGKLDILGTNARLGEGDYLVAEADESDGSFLHLSPTIAVVTNIDNEHMDYFGTFEELKKAFRLFLDKVPFYGKAVLCLDDEEVAGLLAELERPYVTYGLTTQATIMADDVTYSGFASSYRAYSRGNELGEVTLNVPGQYNVYNSLAAIAVGLELDIPFKEISTALAGFGGLQRRFQLIGEAGGISVYDDYGHHPTEIRVTLAAAREGWKGRVIAIFQPHRYSRTRDLLNEFGTAFHNADEVLVCDIYAAGEDAIEGLTGRDVAETIVKHGHHSTKYVGSKEEAVDAALAVTAPGDFVITLGAGDIWQAAQTLTKKLGVKSHG